MAPLGPCWSVGGTDDVLDTEDARAFSRYTGGVSSTADLARLALYYEHVREELAHEEQVLREHSLGEQASGRAASNLEFDGNRVYPQKFFVASFPGIFEGVWKRMTEGAHKALLSCACVFFQDKAGGIFGQHAEPCLCAFLAESAPEQKREPQKGDVIKDGAGRPVLDEKGQQHVYGDTVDDAEGGAVLGEDGNPKPWSKEVDKVTRDEGGAVVPVLDSKGKPIKETVGDFFWDGPKPPWGCLWCAMWRHNVLALHECGQQAVVVHQCAPGTRLKEGDWAENDRVEWGTHMGLGNAQRGEARWMREVGIPLYAYTVDQYAELVSLAQSKARVPERTLSPARTAD